MRDVMASLRWFTALDSVNYFISVCFSRSIPRCSHTSRLNGLLLLWLRPRDEFAHWQARRKWAATELLSRLFRLGASLLRDSQAWQKPVASAWGSDSKPSSQCLARLKQIEGGRDGPREWCIDDGHALPRELRLG